MNFGINETSYNPSDLSRFGFDCPEEEWLSRVRRATQTVRLGMLGEYELLEEISRGAQGVVYRAQRMGDTNIVAIKRHLAGSFATNLARTRFERELETVAALRHRHIVRALNIESNDGIPLLVMEWIDGVPIDRWADSSRERNLDVRAMLAVFMNVCDAVQHAHQRGVIHRDLKPSNILVDAAGGPHLLDFGLAKLTNDAGNHLSTLTGTSDFLGTPAYAAPEQIRGDHESVDIRTDIYALGVVLFRMMTGHLPFDNSEGLAELLWNIQYTEAVKPSRVNREINDELDAIIGKATAKDLDRRYASIDAFIADLRRYLSGEPVEAKRGRRWYELRKSVQRHRTAASVLLVFLLVSSSATLALWRMYTRQSELLIDVASARDAEARAHRSTRQQQGVLENLLTAAAEIGKGANIDVRRAWLDEAARLVEADLTDDPGSQAAAHDAIGRTYQRLALYSDAEAHLRTALELRRSYLPADHLDLAVSLNHLGSLLQDSNRFAEAEPCLNEALTMRRRLHQLDHPDLVESLNGAGLLSQFHHDYKAAIELHEEALAMQRRLGGRENADMAETLGLIGTAYLNQFRFSDAELAFRHALEIDSVVLGEEHRETAAAKINLAKALFNLGRYSEAEPLFHDAIDNSRRLLGDLHDNVAWGLHRLGLLQQANGEYAEAEASMRESLFIYRRCFGDDDHYVAIVLNSLGTLQMDRGDFLAAKSMFDEALSIQEALSPLEYANEIWRQNRLAEWSERTGDMEAAAHVFRQIMDERSYIEELELPYALRCMRSFARIHLFREDFGAAESLLVEALELRREKLGPYHPELAQSLIDIGSVLRAEGRYDEAVWLVEQGIGIQRRALGNTHPELAQGLLELATIADSIGNLATGDEARCEAIEICARRECHMTYASLGQ